MSDAMAMSGFDYGERLQTLFGSLAHGGSLQDRPGAVFGEAGGRERGASVRLWLQTEGERIAAARFQAYGCPYLLAGAESLCRWLEQRRCPELKSWNWRMAEAELDVPAEKRARLLLIEDALRNAAAALKGNSPAKAG